MSPNRLLKIALFATGLLVLVLVLFSAYLRLRPAVEPPIAGDVAVVVSPHPDDETYAMGATIAEQSLAGKRIIGVLLTDGDSSRFVEPWAAEEGSDLDGDGDVDRWDFGLARREEYREAMDILGADELIFLGAAESQGEEGLLDTELEAGDVMDALEPVADRFPKAAWFTTARYSTERFYGGDFKNHPDHAATAEAIEELAVSRGNEAYYFKVYVYFLPTFARFAPQRLAPSDEARALKQDATDAYRGIGAMSTPELFEAAPADPFEYLSR